jgi:ABC-2 type transport system ATP-binding protein
MAKDFIGRFGLRPGARIKKLSKGQARQVALLCALCHRPELLLLDEPAGGLDALARREFLEASIHALSDTGTTIVYSSHYLSDVERLAGRVVMLHDTKVLIDNSIDELHESFSIALVPHRPQGTSDALLDLPECLGVRARSDAVHAVFRLDPDDACALITSRLGVSDSVCRTAGLEEMFIEIAGGER